MFDYFLAMSLRLVTIQQESIDNYVQTALDDLSFVAKVVKGDQTELKKINRDFGQSYRFEKTQLSFKPPFMVRAESKVEDSSVAYILNGTSLVYKLGGFKTSQNLANKPGRRQSTLDIGVLSKGLIHRLYEAKYVETSADKSVVYDLTFCQADIDKSRQRIYLDSNLKVILKREWFNQEGKQIATFLYSQPKQFANCWIPTHMEVLNSDGIVAGQTDYQEIKVNSGLSDTLFQSK